MAVHEQRMKISSALLETASLVCLILFGQLGIIVQATPFVSQIGSRYPASLQIGYGKEVALSGDGTRVIVGSPGDLLKDIGAAYVYRLENDEWTLETTTKLDPQGTNTGTAPKFGWSVDMDFTGSTVIIGAYQDSTMIGAFYIFARSGTAWAMQGGKQVPEDMIGIPRVGSSVSISSNGNTVAVGGPYDGSPRAGACWIYTRSGDSWTAQAKIIPPCPASTDCLSGYSVSLSGSGDLLAIGGWLHAAPYARVKVYTRSASTWTLAQEFAPSQGEMAPHSSIHNMLRVSPDGKSIAVGYPTNNNLQGAVWMFHDAEGDGTFVQQGNGIVPADLIGNALFGLSIDLAYDGRTMLIGAPLDEVQTGGFFVYSKDESGVWTHRGKFRGTVAAQYEGQGFAVSISHDARKIICTRFTGTLDSGNFWYFARTTSAPTKSPSSSPTKSPSRSPTLTSPSKSPTTSKPSRSPTKSPSTSPATSMPSRSPTTAPSKSPTTFKPTKSPSLSPTKSKDNSGALLISSDIMLRLCLFVSSCILL